MTERYIVGSKTKHNGMHIISSIPKEHDVRGDADKEAARLARLEPSKIFIVMKIVTEVEYSDITVRRY